jgi:hypothetical protein
LKDIVRHHLEGTRFGIKVDPRDGLLSQGAEMIHASGAAGTTVRSTPTGILPPWCF